MPVADTEVLFALSPKDPKHQDAVRILKETGSLMVPDAAVFEVQTVLRARGTLPPETKVALLAIHEALRRSHIEEVNTMDTRLLALQCELEDRHGLSYFDSLIAASSLVLDRQVVSDDEAFDRVPDLKRIPLSKGG